MYTVFLKEIKINKVRHLKNISIPISNTEKKHLILTGKNGSGKTSMLQAISKQLNYLTLNGDFETIEHNIESFQHAIGSGSLSENKVAEYNRYIDRENGKLVEAKQGLELSFNIPYNGMKAHFNEGDFVVAFYEANRTFAADVPKHVEKVDLKDYYKIDESPRSEFLKYILDLKVTEAISYTSGKKDRADSIKKWFDGFERLLQRIFEDKSIKLVFDEESFSFTLYQDGREPFDFNQLSDGYAAILDIVVDLMVRMGKRLNGGLSFDVPGIVLIDEIETHLHLELQRNVIDFLESVFPNIQFIITTHSPFILSSAKNTVIYDLENGRLVVDGLTNLPYEGIVKGYFEVDELSIQLREKYSRYKELVKKETISDDDMEEIASLEMYLDEIPDYLALKISTEYRKIKSEFELREDL